MRAQYKNVGWQVAQNYIMGAVSKVDVVNGFNIYKIIAESDSPKALFSKLADKLEPLSKSKIKANTDNIDSKIEGDGEETHQNYLHFFSKYKFLEDK